MAALCMLILLLLSASVAFLSLFLNWKYCISLLPFWATRLYSFPSFLVFPYKTVFRSKQLFSAFTLALSAKNVLAALTTVTVIQELFPQVSLHKLYNREHLFYIIPSPMSDTHLPWRGACSLEDLGGFLLIHSYCSDFLLDQLVSFGWH